MRSLCVSSGQTSRISPSDSGSRSLIGSGGGAASMAGTLGEKLARPGLGAIFAGLVKTAAERGHIERLALQVGHHTIVVVFGAGLERRGWIGLDSRDRRLHLGALLERAEAARVVGDPDRTQLGEAQPAEVVDVERHPLGVLAPGLDA